MVLIRERQKEIIHTEDVYMTTQAEPGVMQHKSKNAGNLQKLE